LTTTEAVERHTIAVLVDNEPGVLARVIGLFSGRGYNIESLTVAETDLKNNLSRITIVTSGTPMIIEQIKNQLNRIVPVHTVHDLTAEGSFVERELALIKVTGGKQERARALKTAEEFEARVLSKGDSSLVFELTGTTRTLDKFIAAMAALAKVDICRTGVVAVTGAGNS
jgi:acetolactate synthase I/III small subunit